MSVGAITERHVQSIWYDAALRPRELYTRDGRAVRVVDPGVWNLAAGPDFTGAVLEIGPGRTRLVGDVEVHLSPADWERHGHGADAAYRGVVAHVTWLSGPIPASLPAASVSIWLGRFATADVGFDPAAIDLGAYPFDKQPSGMRPCERALAAAPDRAGRLLERAGGVRLREKAERLRGRLARVARPETGRRQVYYEEVMNALGYVANSAGFRHVAESVPYADVVREPWNAESAFLTAATFVEWQRGGVRPNNRPELRLAAAASFFAATEVMALADARDFAAGECRSMVRAMTEGRHVGPGRAAAILANVVVPFALAEGRLAEPPDWLPPEDVSAPVRLTAWRLFGRDHNPRAWWSGNGLRIQGLIRVYRECCLRRYPECEPCELAAVGSGDGV